MSVANRIICLLAILASLTSACSSDRAPQPAGPEHSQGDLSVEVRGAARIRLEQQGTDLAVTLTLDRVAAADLVPTTELKARGTIERFPEAALRLYAATIPIGPTPACANKPTTLALALTRRLENARVSGSLAAYCEGTPTPLRILRLAGRLPLE